MILPLTMRVFIKDKGKQKINLWLPLFLIWPFLGLIFLLLSPIILIVALFVWISKNKNPLRQALAIYEFACAIGGLEIEILDVDSEVKIFVV